MSIPALYENPSFQPRWEIADCQESIVDPTDVVIGDDWTPFIAKDIGSIVTTPFAEPSFPRTAELGGSVLVLDQMNYLEVQPFRIGGSTSGWTWKLQFSRSNDNTVIFEISEPTFALNDDLLPYLYPNPFPADFLAAATTGATVNDELEARFLCTGTGTASMVGYYAALYPVGQHGQDGRSSFRGSRGNIASPVDL